MNNLKLIEMLAEESPTIKDGKMTLDFDMDNRHRVNITEDKYQEMLDAVLETGKLPGGKIWANSSILHGVVVKDGNIFNPYIHRYNMTYRVLDPLITMVKSDELRAALSSGEGFVFDMLWEMFKGSIISYAFTKHMPSMQLGRCFFAPNMYTLREAVPGAPLTPEDMAYNHVIMEVSKVRELNYSRNWSTPTFLVKRMYEGANVWLVRYVLNELQALEKGGAEFIAKYRYMLNTDVADVLSASASKKNPDSLRNRIHDMAHEYYDIVLEKRVRGTAKRVALKEKVALEYDIVNDVFFDIYVRAGLVGTIAALHNFPDNYPGLSEIETHAFDDIYESVKDKNIKEGNKELFAVLAKMVASGDVETMSSTGRTFLI